VGDVSLHVIVEGSGTPVVLESGLGGSSIEWGEVSADLARGFTVIRYDRPGLAWSPGASCDRRPAAVVARIKGILDALEISGPCILVGHSLGGLHVRVMASLYPELVSGLVMVDPSHEEMMDKNPRSTETMAAILGVFSRLAPVGVARLGGRAYVRTVVRELQQPLDPAQRQAMHCAALLSARSVHGVRALAAEFTLLPTVLEDVKSITRDHPVPAIPVTVITAAAPAPNAAIAEARRQIDELHQKQVASVAMGRRVLAERSGHLVPFDQPEVIVSCVREVAATAGPGT